MDNNPDRVSVFLCRPDTVVDAELIRHYKRLLDPVERVRFDNFRLGHDAHTFLVAHALLRAALSHVYDVPPESWRFRVGPWGRPEVECSGRPPGISLSHCQGLVACMVAIGCSCGVDIEQLRAIDNPLALATDVFASSELVQMRNLSGERLIERFYSLWTLKEAYLKARGTGLTEPLDAVAFDWDDDRILPSFKDEWMEVRRQWTFTLRRPTPSHVLAAAVAGVLTASSDIPIHWLVPLRGLYATQQALSGSFSA